MSYDAVIQYAKANPDHLRHLDAMWELHNSNTEHWFTARMVMQRAGWRPNLTRFKTLGILLKVGGGAGSTGQVRYALADPQGFEIALRELRRI